MPNLWAPSIQTNWGLPNSPVKPSPLWGEGTPVRTLEGMRGSTRPLSVTFRRENERLVYFKLLFSSKTLSCTGTPHPSRLRRATFPPQGGRLICHPSNSPTNPNFASNHKKGSCAIWTQEPFTCSISCRSEVAAFLKGLDALGANVLSTEHNHVLGIITEDTGGLILLQDDRRSIHVDLQRILFCDIQRAAQFDRKDDATQFIYFPHDSGRFQINHPFHS